jgi:hypothetical protein
MTGLSAGAESSTVGAYVNSVKLLAGPGFELVATSLHIRFATPDLTNQRDDRYVGLASNRRFEEHCPNGRYMIRKPSLRDAPVKGRFWPIALKK